jgi:dipeptidyl aminopeptidase/acylaminoacyl peptidase
VRPGGEDIPKGGGGSEAEEFIKFPAVSTDGSHILMTTEEEGGVNLYMRVNDAVTYEIAHGKQSIRLIGMTSDGSKVVFASRDHVTPDDTDAPFSNDIYVWEEQTNEITRVSQGNGAGDSNECEPPEGPGFIFCSAVPLNTERHDSDDPIASESGDVYFYSPEQLDPNNPGVFNEKNLYVYRHGAVKYVATLDANTSINRIQISPDGNHVAFLTAARLTSYDNQGWREMYTYDANTGTVRCASCIPDGSPPKIMRFEPPGFRAINKTADVLASESGPFMANDGRVAFTTSDALVPQDTDGVEDVYEFVDSRPRLISSGTSQRSVFEGNAIYPPAYTGLESFSADGIDLYFSTYDTLAPQDHNGPFIKFYDARTNGGFPISPPLQPCVAADECHGTGSATPGEPQIGTGANLGGGGNELTAPKRKAKKGRRGRKKACARKCRRHRARHRHRHAARLESRNG